MTTFGCLGIKNPDCLQTTLFQVDMLVQFLKRYTLTHSPSILAGCSLSCPLCSGGSLNHSFFACLSFTHSLSGMNHISVASPLLPASVSKQKQQPTDQLLISVMREILPPQQVPGSPIPGSGKAINRQELPRYLLQTLLPSRAVSPYL